ncbi:MAG: hypothetical protein PHQ60_04875 [Sideroxydans sp.]|nr:hypothetical protein [Sideroxydans sp.]
MNTILRNAVVTFLLAVHLPAWSLDNAAPATNPLANTYFALGYDAISFKANRSGIIAATPSLSSGATIESASSNLSGVFGWKMDEHLAMQFDLVSFGSVRATDNGISKQILSSTIFSVSAILSQQVSDNLSIFGKLGGTYWGLRNQDSDKSVNDGFGPSFGAGIDFNLYGGKERMLRLEWTHYKMDGVFLNSADGLSLGALFNF